MIQTLPLYRVNFPRQFVNGALGVYIVSAILVGAIYPDWIMHLYWWCIGLVCIVSFFYGTSHLTHTWAFLSTKAFEKKLFWTGWLIRAITVVLMYWLFQILASGQLDFEPSDVIWYAEEASFIADEIYEGHFNVIVSLEECLGGKADLSDSGYPIYLGIVYALVGKSVILARLLQSFFGAAIGVLIYRVTQRHFDEPTARMAGIMTMLMPSLVMYCGLHLKEVIMTYLTIQFVESADGVLISRNFNWRNLLAVAVVGLLLFTFRTVLAATLFFAFAVTLILSSSQSIKGGKRVMLIICSFLFVAMAFSGRIKSEVMEIVNKDIRTQQRVSMDMRYGTGKGNGLGNKFANYASAAVFAPLIFTIPFPTMVETYGQEQKRMLHGGCFVKNVMSGFTILSIFMLLLGGNLRSLDAEWRKHVFPLAVLCGYLLVLVFSEFAHSERFHQPVLPLLMMFSAYGVTHLKPRWRWMFSLWCVLVCIMCVGWAFIKIKGRGLA